MNVSPVSFGSLMVFTLNDGKPKAPIPTLVDIAFENNEQLKDFELCKAVPFSEKIDGTVHNATKNFADSLDSLYRSSMPKDSKKVKLTIADFYVNPRDTVKKYFLTAANDKLEDKLHSILSKTGLFYSAKFKK